MRWLGVYLTFSPFLLAVGCATLPRYTGDVGAAPVQQGGAVNAAATDVVDINGAMPLGLGGLLGVVVWLSHRREMARISNSPQQSQSHAPVSDPP